MGNMNWNRAKTRKPTYTEKMPGSIDAKSFTAAKPKKWKGHNARKKAAEYVPNPDNFPVRIFTDGACLQNPGGAGGWAAIIWQNGTETEMVGSDRSTTNNKMEMMGPIMALESFPHPVRVVVLSDSQYVVRGASQWLRGWKAKGWKTAAGEPVKNRDLWERIDAQCQRHQVSWRWVRGHNGHRENERCDELAGRAAREQVSHARP